MIENEINGGEESELERIVGRGPLLHLSGGLEGCGQDNIRCQEIVWQQACAEALKWPVGLPSWFWDYIRDFASGKTVVVSRAELESLRQSEAESVARVSSSLRAGEQTE